MAYEKDVIDKLQKLTEKERRELINGNWFPINRFDAKVETDNAVAWIKEYFDAQPNAKGAVLGISGGKDSAVCAGLLVKAIGADRVTGLSLPNGEQPDLMDARLVAKTLQIDDFHVININAGYSRLHDHIEKGYRDKISYQGSINMLPRLRMTTLYAIAATKHYRVCGTGNASEIFAGYFTKFGDGACDFNPIADFTTDEVVAIGDYLKLPKEVIHKVPSDGISGLSDEDNLGVTYKDINLILRGGADEVPKDIYDKIMEKHEYNAHKFEMPKVYIRK